MNSKIFISILSLSLIAGTILPATTYAKQPEWMNKIIERTKIRKNQNPENKIIKENFCASLLGWTSGIDNKMMETGANFSAKVALRDKKWEEKRAARDRKLEENRAKWDRTRIEHYKKLLEKARTDEQKQAVLKFQAIMEAAIKARKEAVNVAIDTYRAEADKLISIREAATLEARKIYKETYDAAIARAKASCASGANSSETKDRLKSELRVIKEKFVADMNSVNKPDLKPLIIKRHYAIKKAIDDFKTAIESARQELKNALGI